MQCVLKMSGLMEFNKLNEDWGKIDYLGGSMFVGKDDFPKFAGVGTLKEVELGVTLMSGKTGTGIRVEKVLSAVFGK